MVLSNLRFIVSSVQVKLSRQAKTFFLLTMDERPYPVIKIINVVKEFKETMSMIRREMKSIKKNKVEK